MEEVTLSDVRLVSETEKSWVVECDGVSLCLPKSQIRSWVARPGQRYDLVLNDWCVKEAAKLLAVVAAASAKIYSYDRAGTLIHTHLCCRCAVCTPARDAYALWELFLDTLERVTKGKQTWGPIDFFHDDKGLA